MMKGRNRTWKPTHMQKRRNRAAIQWRKAIKNDQRIVMAKWRAYLRLNEIVRRQTRRKNNKAARDRARNALEGKIIRKKNKRKNYMAAPERMH